MEQKARYKFHETATQSLSHT